MTGKIKQVANLNSHGTFKPGDPFLPTLMRFHEAVHAYHQCGDGALKTAALAELVTKYVREQFKKTPKKSPENEHCKILSVESMKEIEEIVKQHLDAINNLQNNTYDGLTQ